MTSTQQAQKSTSKGDAMSFEEIMGIVSRLMVDADALAAIGARLTTSASDSTTPPEVSGALDNVLTAVGISDVDSLSPPQRAMAAAGIRSFFSQASDLLAHPGREPGWSYTDPDLLEGQGRASSIMPKLIDGAVPDLGAVTSFLDVGTGVGWLAVSAAQVWPDATVVGVDVWEPALQRARRNVSDSGLESRIEIRNQNVLDLDDVDRYDCAWVPSFFLSDDVIAAALARVVTALRPGGWAVVGRYEPPDDPLPRATMAVRTLRDGGCQLDAERATELLRAAGCPAARPLPRKWPMPVAFVAGRKP